LEPESSQGHFSIGVFKIKTENRINIENSLKEVLKEIESIGNMEIKGKSYDVIKYLSGDLKFLALFMGIMSANSK
jgi:hypothetical protein